MKRLDEIFIVEYGNQLDLNKCEECQAPQGVNFVNRSSSNCGVSARVLPSKREKIYPAGCITSAMGGSVLSSFVQQDSFVTGQNVKVLRPRLKMSLGEKMYYCACIEANRFRFSTFGREANTSFESLLIPSREEIPAYASDFNLAHFKKDYLASFDFSALHEKSVECSVNTSLKPLGELFDVKNGIVVTNLSRSKVKKTKIGFLSYAPRINKPQVLMLTFAVMKYLNQIYILKAPFTYQLMVKAVIHMLMCLLWSLCQILM